MKAVCDSLVVVMLTVEPNLLNISSSSPTERVLINLDSWVDVFLLVD